MSLRVRRFDRHPRPLLSRPPLLRALQLLTSASLSSSFSSSLGLYEAAAAHWHRGVAYDRLGYTNEAIVGG